MFKWTIPFIFIPALQNDPEHRYSIFAAHIINKEDLHSINTIRGTSNRTADISMKNFLNPLYWIYKIKKWLYRLRIDRFLLPFKHSLYIDKLSNTVLFI